MSVKNIKNSNGIGRRIRELRKKKRLTQDELGSLIGSNGKTISLYERGKFNPASHVIIALAKSLDTSADELLRVPPKILSFQDEELIEILREVDQLPTENRDFIKNLLKLLNASFKNSANL